MLKQAISVSCLLFAATGCTTGKQNRSTPPPVSSTQTLPAVSRPVIALVPIIDHTKNNDLPWNLSQELTTTIHERLTQKGSIVLSDQAKVNHLVKTFNKNQSPFSDQLDWVKKTFTGSEFVVFMELIEHEEVPVRNTKNLSSADTAANLNMSLRVRMLDLRGPQPSIVLQEIVHDSHHIPKQFTRANFHQVEWGKGSFNISPLGLAHAQLTKEIASRIEDYALLAKHRVSSKKN